MSNITIDRQQVIFIHNFSHCSSQIHLISNKFKQHSFELLSSNFVFKEKLEEQSKRNSHQISEEEKKKIDLKEEISLCYPQFDIVRELGSGDAFGEIALINNSRRTASIICKEDTTFAVLSKQSYDKILSQYHQTLQQRNISFLQKFTLFAHLGRSKLDSLFRLLEKFELKKNQVLYTQGEESKYVYFLCEGEVEILQETVNLAVGKKKQGQQIDPELSEVLENFNSKYKCKIAKESTKWIKIAILSQNSYFGHEEILFNTQRQYKAQVCSSNALIYGVQKQKFLGIIKMMPDSMEIMHRELQEKSHWRVNQFEKNKNTDKKIEGDAFKAFSTIQKCEYAEQALKEMPQAVNQFVVNNTEIFQQEVQEENNIQMGEVIRSKKDIKKMNESIINQIKKQISSGKQTQPQNKSQSQLLQEQELSKKLFKLTLENNLFQEETDKISRRIKKQILSPKQYKNAINGEDIVSEEQSQINKKERDLKLQQILQFVSASQREDTSQMNQITPYISQEVEKIPISLSNFQSQETIQIPKSTNHIVHINPINVEQQFLQQSCSYNSIFWKSDLNRQQQTLDISKSDYHQSKSQTVHAATKNSVSPSRMNDSDIQKKNQLKTQSSISQFILASVPENKEIISSNHKNSQASKNLIDHFSLTEHSPVQTPDLTQQFTKFSRPNCIFRPQSHHSGNSNKSCKIQKGISFQSQSNRLIPSVEETPRQIISNATSTPFQLQKNNFLKIDIPHYSISSASPGSQKQFQCKYSSKIRPSTSFTGQKQFTLNYCQSSIEQSSNDLKNLYFKQFHPCSSVYQQQQVLNQNKQSLNSNSSIKSLLQNSNHIHSPKFEDLDSMKEIESQQKIKLNENNLNNKLMNQQPYITPFNSKKQQNNLPISSPQHSNFSNQSNFPLRTKSFPSLIIPPQAHNQQPECPNQLFENSRQYHQSSTQKIKINTMNNSPEVREQVQQHLNVSLKQDKTLTSSMPQQKHPNLLANKQNPLSSSRIQSEENIFQKISPTQQSFLNLIFQPTYFSRITKPNSERRQSKNIHMDKLRQKNENYSISSPFKINNIFNKFLQKTHEVSNSISHQNVKENQSKIKKQLSKSAYQIQNKE